MGNSPQLEHLHISEGACETRKSPCMELYGAVSTHHDARQHRAAIHARVSWQLLYRVTGISVPHGEAATLP